MEDLVDSEPSGLLCMTLGHTMSMMKTNTFIILTRLTLFKRCFKLFAVLNNIHLQVKSNEYTKLT